MSSYLHVVCYLKSNKYGKWLGDKDEVVARSPADLSDTQSPHTLTHTHLTLTHTHTHTHTVYTHLLTWRQTPRAQSPHISSCDSWPPLWTAWLEHLAV